MPPVGKAELEGGAVGALEKGLRDRPEAFRTTLGKLLGLELVGGGTQATVVGMEPVVVCGNTPRLGWLILGWNPTLERLLRLELVG